MRACLAELLGTSCLVFSVLSASGSSLVVAALTVGGVLVACVWLGAHLSGAHFNPAVSLARYLRGELSPADLWSYWAAQLAGAVLAAVAALGVAPVQPARDVSRGAALGPALAVEFLFTFLVVCVGLVVGASPQQELNVGYGLQLGAVVTVGVLTVSAVSGAAFNPAVVFAMAVHGDVAWRSLWVYGTAQAGGAVAAVALLTRSRRLQPDRVG